MSDLAGRLEAVLASWGQEAENAKATESNPYTAGIAVAIYRACSKDLRTLAAEVGELERLGEGAVSDDIHQVAQDRIAELGAALDRLVGSVAKAEDVPIEVAREAYRAENTLDRVRIVKLTDEECTAHLLAVRRGAEQAEKERIRITIDKNNDQLRFKNDALRDLLEKAEARIAELEAALLKMEGCRDLDKVKKIARVALDTSPKGQADD